MMPTATWPLRLATARSRITACMPPCRTLASPTVPRRLRCVKFGAAAHAFSTSPLVFPRLAPLAHHCTRPRARPFPTPSGSCHLVFPALAPLSPLLHCASQALAVQVQHASSAPLFLPVLKRACNGMRTGIQSGHDDFLCSIIILPPPPPCSKKIGGKSVSVRGFVGFFILCMLRSIIMMM